ncbi:DUF5305 family protein [Haloprofundus sp. MHR1]|uniref:DUF5305 family protein n=1 Tax=Haloprofundus sp. MHR1 TaxID=2572921 RepID=UPI0010BEEC57|nr:DUF5305 family protein [Haloprofundus sp. MHR1]QCJ45983.1 hypothetical protein FCF25_02095 [Haloprofundus sp. MHR1]
MIPGIHKLRYLLATQSGRIFRICIALTLISILGAGITFTSPPTTEVTTTTDRQTIETAINSRATIEHDSALYSQGETLSNMPVYPRSSAPTVIVSAVTNSSSGAPVQGTQRISLVYEAETSSGETFWKQTQRLQKTNVATPSQRVVSSAPVNISAVDQRVAQLESEIRDAGRVYVYLQVDSQYSTDTYEGLLSDRGEIVIRDGSYEIEHISMQNEHRTTENQIQPLSSKVFSLSLPILGLVVVPHTTLVFVLVALSGAVGSVATVVYADDCDPERERAALHKARYAEWISAGTLPQNLTHQAVQIETLEDLVDVAIDSEKRIVYDVSQSRYAILDGEIVYIYQDGEPLTEAEDSFEFPLGEPMTND